MRSALDGSQIRTIFERLTSDDYGWRGAMAGFSTWGGKINALSPQDTAVTERDSVALFSVSNFWDNPEEDEKHLTWNRTLYRDMFAATGGVPVPNDRTGGCYINWPDPDLLEEEWNQSGVPWSELYYGGNYKKLQEAKGRWDPHKVFNHVCRSSRAENRCDPPDSGVVVITHVLWLHAAFPPVSLPADQRPARGLSCDRLRAYRRALNGNTLKCTWHSWSPLSR